MFEEATKETISIPKFYYITFCQKFSHMEIDYLNGDKKKLQKIKM